MISERRRALLGSGKRRSRAAAALGMIGGSEALSFVTDGRGLDRLDVRVRGRGSGVIKVRSSDD